MSGVYGKYIIKKTSGKKIDPESCFFILKLDSDEAARKAALTYAEHCGNDELADGIRRCVEWLDDPPECTCGGGRDMDVTCPFHDGGWLGHPVWRYGEEPTSNPTEGDQT